jgi:hypothetical protein
MHTREAQERTTKHSHVMILAISVAASKLHILLELRDNISDAKRAKRRVLFVCVFFLRIGNLLFFCSFTKFLVAVNLPTEERLSHQVPIPFFPGVPKFFSSIFALYSSIISDEGVVQRIACIFSSFCSFFDFWTRRLRFLLQFF